MGCCLSTFFHKNPTKTLAVIEDSTKHDLNGKQQSKQIDTLKDLHRYIESTPLNTFDLDYVYMAALRLKPTKEIQGYTYTKKAPITGALLIGQLETQHDDTLQIKPSQAVCSKMNSLLHTLSQACMKDDAVSEERLWRCMNLTAYLGCKMHIDIPVNIPVINKCRSLVQRKFSCYDPNVIPLISSFDIYKCF